MMGRPIMWRQTSFCFYRPGALAMADALAEIPFSFPKVFLFSVIVSFFFFFFFFCLTVTSPVAMFNGN
jgi:hypothetical protein